MNLLRIILITIVVGISSALPITLPTESNTSKWVAGSIFLLGAALVTVGGCLCCKRKKGFKEFNNEPGSATHVVSAESPFPIFRPLNQTHTNEAGSVENQSEVTPLKHPDSPILPHNNIEATNSGIIVNCQLSNENQFDEPNISPEYSMVNVNETSRSVNNIATIRSNMQIISNAITNIVTNDHMEMDNNNGPISELDIQNIANNNAEGYIQNQNEIYQNQNLNNVAEIYQNAGNAFINFNQNFVDISNIPSTSGININHHQESVGGGDVSDLHSDIKHDDLDLPRSYGDTFSHPEVISENIQDAKESVEDIKQNKIQINTCAGDDVNEALRCLESVLSGESDCDSGSCSSLAEVQLEFNNDHFNTPEKSQNKITEAIHRDENCDNPIIVPETSFSDINNALVYNKEAQSSLPDACFEKIYNQVEISRINNPIYDETTKNIEISKENIDQSNLNKIHNNENEECDLVKNIVDITPSLSSPNKNVEQDKFVPINLVESIIICDISADNIICNTSLDTVTNNKNEKDDGENYLNEILDLKENNITENTSQTLDGEKENCELLYDKATEDKVLLEALKTHEISKFNKEADSLNIQLASPTENEEQRSEKLDDSFLSKNDSVEQILKENLGFNEIVLRTNSEAFTGEFNDKTFSLSKEEQTPSPDINLNGMEISPIQMRTSTPTKNHKNTSLENSQKVNALSPRKPNYDFLKSGQINLESWDKFLGDSFERSNDDDDSVFDDCDKNLTYTKDERMQINDLENLTGDEFFLVPQNDSASELSYKDMTESEDNKENIKCKDLSSDSTDSDAKFHSTTSDEEQDSAKLAEIRRTLIMSLPDAQGPKTKEDTSDYESGTKSAQNTPDNVQTQKRNILGVLESGFGSSSTSFPFPDYFSVLENEGTSEGRNEIYIKYSAAGPLSPIMEDWVGENDDEKSNQENINDQKLSSSDSICRTFIVNDVGDSSSYSDRSAALTSDKPRHVLGSWCSNDTLFNVEDALDIEKITSPAENMDTELKCEKSKTSIEIYDETQNEDSSEKELDNGLDLIRKDLKIIMDDEKELVRHESFSENLNVICNDRIVTPNGQVEENEETNKDIKNEILDRVWEIKPIIDEEITGVIKAKREDLSKEMSSDRKEAAENNVISDILDIQCITNNPVESKVNSKSEIENDINNTHTDQMLVHTIDLANSTETKNHVDCVDNTILDKLVLIPSITITSTINNENNEVDNKNEQKDVNSVKTVENGENSNLNSFDSVYKSIEDNSCVLDAFDQSLALESNISITNNSATRDEFIEKEKSRDSEMPTHNNIGFYNSFENNITDSGVQYDIYDQENKNSKLYPNSSENISLICANMLEAERMPYNNKNLDKLNKISDIQTSEMLCDKNLGVNILTEQNTNQFNFIIDVEQEEKNLMDKNCDKSLELQKTFFVQEGVNQKDPKIFYVNKVVEDSLMPDGSTNIISNNIISDTKADMITLHKNNEEFSDKGDELILTSKSPQENSKEMVSNEQLLLNGDKMKDSVNTPVKKYLIKKSECKLNLLSDDNADVIDTKLVNGVTNGSMYNGAEDIDENSCSEEENEDTISSNSEDYDTLTSSSQSGQEYELPGVNNEDEDKIRSELGVSQKKILEECLFNLDGENDPWTSSNIKFSESDIMTTSFSSESPMPSPQTNECVQLKFDQQRSNDQNSANENLDDDTGCESEDTSEEFEWKSGNEPLELAKENDVLKISESAEVVETNLDTTLTEESANECVNKPEIEVQNYDDDESTDESEEIEFIPSIWNSSAVPSRSSLKSPENNTGNKEGKSVVFKKEKYLSVYEYPREQEHCSYIEPMYDNSLAYAPNGPVLCFDRFFVTSTTLPFNEYEFYPTSSESSKDFDTNTEQFHWLTDNSTSESQLETDLLNTRAECDLQGTLDTEYKPDDDDQFSLDPMPGGEQMYEFSDQNLFEFGVESDWNSGNEEVTSFISPDTPDSNNSQINLKFNIDGPKLSRSEFATPDSGIEITPNPDNFNKTLKFADLQTIENDDDCVINNDVSILLEGNDKTKENTDFNNIDNLGTLCHTKSTLKLPLKVKESTETVVKDALISTNQMDKEDIKANDELNNALNVLKQTLDTVKTNDKDLLLSDVGSTNSGDEDSGIDSATTLIDVNNRS